MGLLMLRQDWPGTFRRAVRTPKGEIKKILEFEPGEPVELKGAALKAVQGDIGPALVEVTLDPKGRPREVKPPEEAKTETEVTPGWSAEEETAYQEAEKAEKAEEAVVGGDIEG